MCKYQEENGLYEIDCSSAVWSCQIHDIYQEPSHQYGILNFLCDVDWVIETNEKIMLVEYKNANIPQANNPQAFNPLSGDKLDKVAKKYYDSLHYLGLAKADKPRILVYIVDYPLGDRVSRRMLQLELSKRLPFQMQRELSTTRKLIDDVFVVNIQEWNNDSLFGRFPITSITHS